VNCSKLRVFLPVLAGIMFASTGFASAQIVVLGHSAAHGYVAENEMWSSVLESILRARGSQVHVTNAGVNGETTEAELARVDSAVPNGTKIVILTVNGFNDAHKLAAGAAGAAANIAAIKKKINARGTGSSTQWELTYRC
jgi:acyl-CoA thioesterase I